MNNKAFYRAFSDPFGYINCKGFSRYDMEKISVVMFDDYLKTENIDVKSINFPEDIVEVYWYEKGINDQKPWEFIGKVKYKDAYCYVYYIASCDYTGFDCQGDMKLYISEFLSRILKNAIPSYLHNKKKIKELLEKENISHKS